MRVYLVIHYVTGEQIGGVYHTPEAAQRASVVHNAHWISRVVSDEEGCNCESAYCKHHGGMLASDPNNTSGYHVSGRCQNAAGSHRMTFVGSICDECFKTAAPDDPDLFFS